MNVEICEDKQLWEAYQAEQGHGEFLQSWEWGEFQGSVGNKVLRFRITDGEVTHLCAQGFVHTLPLGLQFVYMPRVDLYGAVAIAVCGFLRKQGYIFLRVEPVRHEVQSPACKPQATRTRQPQDTLVLPINRMEKTLLADMHQKTRYNIRLAERKGVTISHKKDIDVFWSLHQETQKRDKFSGHTKTYYRKMLEMSTAYQLTAYVHDEPVASNILIQAGNTFTYLHGASGNRYRNTMAPYLLQWEGMLFAKKNKAKRYDFWGVAPEVMDGEPSTTFNKFTWKADHSLTSVTRFKAGFGGERVTYPDAKEIVFRKSWYRLIRLVKRFL